MNNILVIDPGKGWGHFVSKMYCYQKLAEELNTKIVFLTKKSTQAEHYLKLSSFCEQVIYLEEAKKGIKNFFYNFRVFMKNIHNINKFNFKSCYVFHPSLRYLFFAKFSNITEIWGLGLKFQNFFLKRDRKLYESFFSKTIKNDNEAYEFVRKITSSQKIDFKPIYISDNKNRDTIGIIIASSGNERRWSIFKYIEMINFLKKKNFKKFLIISGIDQENDEKLIQKEIGKDIIFTFTAKKKIKDVIPSLINCEFCVGNDTGFSHLSVNLGIETLIICGDCPPQNYSNLIHHIDIDNPLIRSSTTIDEIEVERVIDRLTKFLNGRGGRVVEGARLESV